jgi:hypothetical protein
MSFFGKIKNFFSGAAAKASDLFKRIFGAEAANDFAKAAAGLMKGVAGAIVLDVVQLIEVSNPVASGPDKRKAAFDKLIKDARLQGLGLGNDMINLLIELAVQAIVKKNIIPA